jgi:hypothetical protein
MNDQEWAECRETIDEAIYSVLLEETDCGPFDGGCVLIALALQQVLGGDIVVLISDQSGRADHAVLCFDGLLWDFDGPLPPSAFIERFEQNELAVLGQRCGGYRPLEPGDLEDAPRDERVVDRLADIFRTVLPGIAPKP